MKAKHLTLDDRKAIEEGINLRLSKTQIARSIGKDPSTVSKEIKKHRSLKPRNRFNHPVVCSLFCSCKRSPRLCSEKCPNYVEATCSFRDRSIGACNHCPKLPSCHLDRFFYNATRAHESYLFHLSDARLGVNLSEHERVLIAQIIYDPLRKGQSVYQVLHNHPEIQLSPKSLYTYIEGGVFKDFGIDNFILKRQVSMRARKKLKKRKEPINYDGHKYSDYQEFVMQNPSVPTTEMDTVYNQQDGPYIQTFIFQNTGLMIGFLQKEKTSEAMASTFSILQDMLGDDFDSLFSLVLTDRGTEFEKVSLFETDPVTGLSRTNIFYCDPQSPSQKPHVENNHNFVRNILPNGRNLKKLSQDDLNLMFSHINLVPRKKLAGKTPYDVFSFFYGEHVLEKLHIRPIEPDAVTLQPFLLKIE
ncbi:MAG: IS30 family transposase [Eubacteriales bacterium]|nr:IS30 family transposase [Eubacteriales bacterium]